MRYAVPGLVCALLILGAGAARADSVTFVDDDMKPVFSVDTDTHAVTVSDTAEAAVRRFQELKADDPLPADLAFMAREAAVRYAVLGLTPPQTWTARFVREVFLSPQDVVGFIDRHLNRARRR